MMKLSKAPRFFRDVKVEATKIAWPTLKDTRAMTIMVFILVILIALYLVAVDMTIGAAMRWILS